MVKIKEKTIEITEDDFATAGAIAMANMVKEMPARFLISDELSEALATTCDVLFNHPDVIEKAKKVKKEKGGKE